MNRRNNIQRRKKKLSSGGSFFKCALILMILASAILSISMLVLSSMAINKDLQAKERLSADSTVSNIPHPPDNRPIESRLRNQVNVHDATNGRKLVLEPKPKPRSDFPAPPQSGTGTGTGKVNSEIYQPSKTGRRLLTYRRFGGRLNNQLFQFITSLQHAKVLKRTFVVPDELRDVDWTGMFDGFGIWDLTSLNNAYDIDWKLGLSGSFVLDEIPESCVLSAKDAKGLLEGGPKLWEEWDEKCPDVIDIAGNTGLLFCNQQHSFCGDAEATMEAYKIYDHLTLSSDLLQCIPSKRVEFKNKGYDEIAIHSRRAGEGGYNWELCVNGNTKTCRSHIANIDKHKVCDVRTMTGNCAIWSDLDYQVKSKRFRKENKKDYRFVLASDGTHDWNIDFKGQFIVANNTEWLQALEKKVNDSPNPEEVIKAMSVSKLPQLKMKKPKDLSNFRANLDALTATLLDLFSLVDSKYFIGAYYSTLSLNACYFRGMDRIYDSNMCWMLMHPGNPHGILPPAEDSVHINMNPKDDDPLPAALTSDVEHAFIRSDDGNFIAIDRYLIHMHKKSVIAVMGDGLVPMTITKGEDGKEKIQADFTCNYGEQVDSPATIVLMKGNQSYNEHYYVRGEKYHTPFSTNGDRFRTMIIMCEKLQYNKSIQRHPPLTMKSLDGKFSLTIGSTFAKPVGTVYGQGKKVVYDMSKTIVHCLNPAYGLKDPRWIIEYLEYHKAIGVTHVHLYNVDMHSPRVQKALQAYRDEGFITRHDWSGKASGEYTTKTTYEHAKWAAQTDCAIRARGIFEYALFSDIDEVAVGGSDPNGYLSQAVQMCDEARKKDKNKVACSFNSNTVSSIYTKLSDDEEAKMQDKLLLERYNRIEAEPHCPANCKKVGGKLDRKFHSGRQKYMANVRDLTIPARPMWTHALGRDYDEMDKIMEVLPDEVMHVRHYQGHWYKNNNLLNSMNEKDAPLPATVMGKIGSSIGSSKDKRKEHTKRNVYDAAKKDPQYKKGIEWIEPVDRPEEYHYKMP